MNFLQQLEDKGLHEQAAQLRGHVLYDPDKMYPKAVPHREGLAVDPTGAMALTHLALQNAT